MTGDLREHVMRDVATVVWPEARELRGTARRRVVRRRASVGAAAAVVLVLVGSLWSSGRFRWDAEQPADRPPGAGAGPAPGLLRGADVGPGHRVEAWGTHDADSDRVELGWPSPWLDACPALDDPPAGFRGLRDAASVTVIPAVNDLIGARVTESVVRMPDEAAAAAVLDEGEMLAARCAAYHTTGKQVRHTVSGLPGLAAGRRSLRMELTENGTGGAPARHTYLFVAVAATVIMVVPSKPVDPGWLDGVATAAVARLCAETDTC